MDEYKQIGFTALRAEDKSFLPPIPLYVKNTKELEEEEKKLCEDFGRRCAPLMKKYIEQEKARREEEARREKEHQERMARYATV